MIELTTTRSQTLPLTHELIQTGLYLRHFRPIQAPRRRLTPKSLKSSDIGEQWLIAADFCRGIYQVPHETLLG